jgi:hypothetical protein
VASSRFSHRYQQGKTLASGLHRSPVISYDKGGEDSPDALFKQRVDLRRIDVCFRVTTPASIATIIICQRVNSLDSAIRVALLCTLLREAWSFEEPVVRLNFLNARLKANRI